MWVELRCRLVEDHESRPHRKRRRERDALALAAAQGAHRAARKVLDAHLVQSLAHSAGHFPLRNGGVLQSERDLAVDGRVNRLQLRVLEHEAGAARENARRRREHVQACNRRRAGYAPAVEVRHQAVEDAKQG